MQLYRIIKGRKIETGIIRIFQLCYLRILPDGLCPCTAEKLEFVSAPRIKAVIRVVEIIGNSQAEAADIGLARQGMSGNDLKRVHIQQTGRRLLEKDGTALIRG